MADELKRMKSIVGSPAEWAADDIVLGKGELAVLLDGANSKLRVGDGVKTFSKSPIVGSPLWKAATGGIEYSAGNVGIGTSTPNAPLEIMGANGLNNKLILSTSKFVAGNPTTIEFRNGALPETSITSDPGTGTFATAHVLGAKMKFLGGQVISFENGGTERLRIDIGGALKVSNLSNVSGTAYLTANAAGVIQRSAANLVTFQPDGSLDMTGNRITNLYDYTAPGATAFNNNDAISKRYVDNSIGGITGANFIGSKDVRVSGDAVPTAAKAGDWVVVSADTFDAAGVNRGKMSAAWIAVLSSESKQAFLGEGNVADYTVYAGDDLFFDGSKWHYVSASTLHNKYLSRFGDTSYGDLIFRARRSAVNARPVTWSGGFKIGSSLASWQAGGVVYGAGDTFNMEGVSNASLVNMALATGALGAAFNNFRFAGNGAFRIPVGTGTAGTAIGAAVHMNAFGTTTPTLVMAYRKDATGTLNRHQPFSVQFRTRGEISGDDTSGTGSNYYQGIVFGTDGRVLLPSDVTTWTTWNAVPKKYVDDKIAGITSGISQATGDGRYVMKTTNQTMTGRLTCAGLIISSNAINVSNNLMINLGDATAGGHGLNRRVGDLRYTLVSDSRLKKKVKPLCPTLELLDKLKPVEFEFKAGIHKQHERHEKHFGFLAQDMQTVFPDLVHGALHEQGEEGDTLAVDYMEMIAVLTKSIQELHAEVKSLKEARP